MTELIKGCCSQQNGSFKLITFLWCAKGVEAPRDWSYLFELKAMVA